MRFVESARGVKWQDFQVGLEDARVSENLNNPNIRYENLSRAQEQWVREAIDATGLPTRNVSLVRYEENTTENANWLGSVNYADGSLRLYSRLGKADITPTKKYATVYHELLHENCPTLDKNDVNYGSREVREEAKMHAYDVAQQTYLTGIPLNAYHAELLEALDKKEITIDRFVRETHTIMGEMRVYDYESLLNVQRQQRSMFDLMTLARDERVLGLQFTGITGTDDEGKFIGIDKTLSALHRITDKDKLEEHFGKMREFAAEFNSPFEETIK